MSGCISIGLLLIGVSILLINPWLGGFFILLALLAAAGSDSGRTMTFVLPGWKRTVNFGPSGPPWAGDEAPLVLDGQTIFAASVARLHEEGPKPPDVEKRRGVPEPIAGTDRPATIWVKLHSGEEFKVTHPSEAATRLGGWFDRLGVQKQQW